MKAVASISQRLRTFGEILGWICAAYWKEARWRLGAVVGFNLLGAVTRASAIGLVLLYVHAQEKGIAIRHWGLEIPSDTSLPTLLGWSMAVLLMALITAAATYIGVALSFSMARDTMQRFLKAVLRVIATGSLARNPLLDEPDAEANLKRVSIGDTTIVIRATIVLTGIALPLLHFVVASVVLFSIDVTLTLVASLALVLYFVPIYWLNRLVVRASREYEDERVTRSQVFNRLLKYAAQAHVPNVDEPAWTDAYLRHPSTGRTIDSLRRIILSSRRVNFVQDVFLGVLLCLIMLVFGSFLVRDQQSWALLIAYFVFFGYALSGLGGTAGKVTRFNRFLPQLHRLKSLIDSGAAAEAIAADQPAASVVPARGWRIAAREPMMPRSEPSRALRPGDRALCISAEPVSTLRLVGFCWQLTRNSRTAGDLLNHVFFCGHVAPPPPLTIQQVLTRRADPSTDEIEAACSHLRHWGVFEEFTQLPEGLESLLTEALYAHLSPLARFTLPLVTGLCANRKVFIIAWNAMSSLSGAERSMVFQRLEDRAVIVICQRFLPSIPEEIDWVVVMHDGAVHGIGDGDWYDELDDDARRQAGFTTAAPAAAEGVEDEDLVDDEEL